MFGWVAFAKATAASALGQRFASGKVVAQQRLGLVELGDLAQAVAQSIPAGQCVRMIGSEQTLTLDQGASVQVDCLFEQTQIQIHVAQRVQQ